MKILHITDIHLRKDSESEINRRVKSIVKYHKKHNLAPDLVVITGDLAYQGIAEEYQMFDSIVIEPLKSGLKIGRSKIIIIPGNHDVNRDAITVPEEKRCKAISSPHLASQALGNEHKRLEAYLEYQKSFSLAHKELHQYSYQEFQGGLYSSRIYHDIEGFSVGVACLNSAWLCSGEEDKENLFLREAQVEDTLKHIEDADIKIALCHHPKNWFNPSEQELIWNDIHREFSLILTGHLHDPISKLTQDTTSESLALSSRALYDGKKGNDVADGFQYYDIALSEKQLTAKYRKYIRRRDTFDKDTEHADNGEYTYNLPVSRVVGSTALIVQSLVEERNSMDVEIKKTLSNLQELDKPIFVTPKLRLFGFRQGSKFTVKSDLEVNEISAGNVIVCGGGAIQ
ncbi:metallophosphoesterase, partial [Akkermansiaceae bacterium]|nr:metallophosphoesterase [Akkermansiaceae bacterium]